MGERGGRPSEAEMQDTAMKTLGMLTLRAQGRTKEAAAIFAELPFGPVDILGHFVAFANIIGVAMDPCSKTETFAIEISREDGAEVEEHAEIASAVVAASLNHDIAGVHQLIETQSAEQAAAVLVLLMDWATAVLKHHMDNPSPDSPEAPCG